MLGSIIMVSSCKDDEPQGRKVVHEGDAWDITSMEYTVVDQRFNPISMYTDSGTKSNAGQFYFNGGSGSFRIDLGSGRVYEDYFSYSENSPDIDFTSVSQTVSTTKFSQNVITISGTFDATNMDLDGTIVEQTASRQFSLVATFVLTKQ